MFKSKKVMSFGFALCTALLAAPMLPAFGAGGDGGPFNGPSLAGTSIPVELERGITQYAAANAIQVCLAEGDSSRGLISLMDRIYEQAHGQLPNKNAVKFARVLGGTRALEPTGYLQSGPVSIGLSSSDTSTKIGYEERALVEGVELYSIPLPTVTFERIQQDSGFDDWGREAEGEKILHGIRIELPKEYGSAVPVYNHKTGKKTKLTLNHVEYAECLSNELQRNAIQ
ncbi:MAG: hypothetical protein NDJ90_08175 [Oligoflexia bacterium]|nr:hypothetical protein [Oligoflexia bacterium]